MKSWFCPPLYWIRLVSAWLRTRAAEHKNHLIKNKLIKLEALMILINRIHPVWHDGPYPMPTDYDKWLSQCKSMFCEYMNTRHIGDPVVVMFGDSIADTARSELRSVPALLNFGRSGYLIQHMRQLFTDMVAYMYQNGIVPDVVVVGTPGGNNLLQRNTVACTITYWLEFLTFIRQTLASPRIVVYGLPQTLDIYVANVKAQMMEVTRKWVVGDGRASVLMLIHGFSHKNRVVPIDDMSCDGVHMTPLGQLQFDTDLYEAIYRGAVVVP